jgi:hypothetical protein
MRIEIDQSGKIENTSRHTFLACSNSIHSILKISAAEKRKLQKYFRKIGKPRLFVYMTFALLVILLLKNRKIKSIPIVVDIEYTGKTGLIKNFIKQFNSNFPVDNLSFRFVGKKSNAHDLAYGAAIGKVKPNLELTSAQIIELIKKSGSA